VHVICVQRLLLFSNPAVAVKTTEFRYLYVFSLRFVCRKHRTDVYVDIIDDDDDNDNDAVEAVAVVCSCSYLFDFNRCCTIGRLSARIGCLASLS
jgi:hypothetical protein